MKITKYINGKTILTSAAFALVCICKDGLRGFQRDREYRLRQEQKEKEKAERQKQREENAKPECELELTVIDGVQHYKNKYGNWCPLKNKTNGDVKITVNKKGGAK